MRRISPLERLRLFGRAGIDVVATLGRSVLFLVGALFGRSRAGKPLQPVSYTHLDVYKRQLSPLVDHA